MSDTAIILVIFALGLPLDTESASKCLVSDTAAPASEQAIRKFHQSREWQPALSDF